MVSPVCALVVTATAFVLYRAIPLLYIELFPRRYWHEPRLALALGAVAASLWLLRRHRGPATWIFLVGSSALVGVSLHDCFVDYGLQYHWFQFGGKDGWVFRGFFEPRENPLIAIPADVLRYLSLVIYIGIFSLAWRITEQHLTRRWS